MTTDPALFALMTFGAKLEDIPKFAESGMTLSDIQNPFLSQDEVLQLVLTRRQSRIISVISAARAQRELMDWNHCLSLLYAFGLTKYGYGAILKYYSRNSNQDILIDTVADTLLVDADAFNQRHTEVELAVKGWQAWVQDATLTRLIAEASMKDRAADWRKHLKPNDLHSTKTRQALNYFGIDHFPDKLMTFLQMDFRYRSILIARLEGQTLSQVGEKASITRERVRQIVKKQLTTLPLFDDVEPYRAILANYDLSQDDFVWLTHCSPLIWTYITLLNEDHPSRPGYEYVLASEQVPEASKAQYASEHQLLFSEDGTVLPLSLGAVLEMVLAQANGRLINETEFSQMVATYVQQYHLPRRYLPGNAHALSAAVARMTVVQRGHGEFRSYQLDDARDFLEELTALFDVAPGIYGIQYFFEADPELMALLDIRVAAELANIVHRIGIKHIPTINKLVRQSQVWIKITNRDDFFLDAIYQNEDQSIDSLVDYLAREYSLHPGTARGTLSRDYPAYFENGLIKLKHWEPQNVNFYSRARRLLTQPLYSGDQVTRILKSIDPDCKTSHILVAKLGYVERGSLYIRDVFTGTTAAIDALFKGPLITVAAINQIGNVNVNRRVREAVRGHELMMINSAEYATAGYLAKNGIDLVMINAFLDHVRIMVPDDEFFTWTSLRLTGFDDPLCEYGMEANFFQHLLFSTGEYARVMTQEPIFIRISPESAIRPRVSDFLRQIVTMPQIGLHELERLLHTEYGVVLTTGRLIEKINEPGGTVYASQAAMVYQNSQAMARAIGQASNR
ncbi:sigma factor-like helix-turn-helix DNA-binding protein [Lapidilactobacillus salsurivasis]